MLRLLAKLMLLLSIGGCPPVFSSILATHNSSHDQSFRMENLNFLKVPTNILGNHPGITSLFLQYNKIEIIRKDDFPPNASQHLVYINLRGNVIKYIEEDAFSNMPNLHVVDLNQNLLQDVPKLKAPKIRELLLRNNKIRRLDYDAMRHYKNLEHLDLKHNEITRINGGSFKDNKKLVFMVLSDNPLRKIEETGLVGPKDLQFLYLENTQLTNLPSQGISSLTTLNIKGSLNLISLPDPNKFEKLSEIIVEYRMHCCAFRAVRDFPKLNNTRPCPDSKSHMDRKKRDIENFTDITDIADFDSLGDSSDIDDFFKKIIDSFHAGDENVTDPCEILIDLPESLDNHLFIKCSPEPDEFNPCEDVMGTHVLRVFSWIISIFAVIGNMFQLVILFSSKQELTVYKLLMYNLGFSNLLMGIYILVLCCVDGYTYGKYYNYAQSWQYNGGCKILGFIALFATQLSVCSLILITVERFLLIIFALQVTNQMKVSHAVMGIALSWVYSCIVALLPLSDIIGSYTKVAICLPMDMHTRVSEGYVVWLLLTYVIAFILIVFCYIRMYINISEVRPGNSSQTIDIQVAKRMSMIIFSNFLCWLPISFAGLMALYSKMEFNVGVGKFLLVFIFPLNACTNPFLYAIFTKVFRGDTLALLNSCGLFKVADANKKGKRSVRRNDSQSALKHFVNIQESAHSCVIANEHEMNTARSTNMDPPDSSMEVLINGKYRDRSENHKNVSSLSDPHRRTCETFQKLPSNSKRGLLESEIKQQCRDPRFRSESNETCSTGISNVETDDDFSRMIGSIQKVECSMLLE